MKRCWEWDPSDRPEFSDVRQKLAGQLEEVTEAYSYLTLNAERDYYNVNEYAENAEAMKKDNERSAVKEGETSKNDELHSPLREVDSGLDNDSEHSGTPPASRKRTEGSTNSDQLLMTPIEQRRGHVNFNFNNQEKLPAVQEIRGGGGGLFNSGFQYSIDDGDTVVNM